jgi:hypothetical protein
MIICLLFSSAFAITFGLYGVQKLQARTEDFIDTNNNLHVSIQAPDNWNSGTATATIHNLNWRAGGIATTNDDSSAIFVIVNMPPFANMIMPFGQTTGLICTLLSQYVTLNSQYDMNFNGYAGHACSISATSDQLNRLPSFIPRINKEFDALLITTQQQHGTYVILYATQLGRMGEFQGMFQNILNSISFGTAGGNMTSSGGGNMTSMTNATAPGGGNMTSPSPNATNTAFQEPALGHNFVWQGTKSSQIDPLSGHANEYVAAVLKPRSDGAVYSGVLTYTAIKGVNVEIWDA